MSTTVVVEQTVLLAVMEENREEAERLLAGFFPGELHHLETACERLSSLIGRQLLLKDHEAGRHAGMARPGHTNSLGDPRSGGVDSRAYGCPRCYEIAGLEPTEEAWS